MRLVAFLLTFLLAIGPRLAQAAQAVQLSDKPRVKQVLYDQLRQWHQVRHRMGGLSKQGIDCSGFVHLTYLKRFGISLPRSTEKLADIGRRVDQDKLAPGDRVFFKTGFKSRHVGIYVEEGKFIHVSKKKGVMVSHLDEEYWADAFWKAVRIEEG